jgi:hypothetical protein
MIVGQVVLILSATVLVLVLERIPMKQPNFDHARLDDYRLSLLKRIVSTPSRLLQRKQPVAADAIEYEYEYEYRDAEYECEETL